jgi:hypothetical protein
VTDKPEWADADLPDAPEDEDDPRTRLWVLAGVAVCIVAAVAGAAWMAIHWKP